MNRQWHTDLTLWGKGRAPQSLDALIAKPDTAQSDAQVFFRALADFLFVNLGRPRWFLDAEITQLLLHSRIENQSLQGVTFPYDSFNLVFEKGITLTTDCEIRFISVCNPRSKMAAQLGGTAMQEFGKRFNNHPFEDSFFVGAVFARNNVDMLTLSVLPLSMPLRVGLEIINKPENVVNDSSRNRVPDEINDSVVKVAVATILYFNACPDLYVSHELGRDQRYQFAGDAKDRKNMRRVLLPSEKKISSDRGGVAASGSKRPHYRGFVLRTLRDERYRRNEDGSFKTVLVEPTAIHPELMEATTNNPIADGG